MEEYDGKDREAVVGEGGAAHGLEVEGQEYQLVTSTKLSVKQTVRLARLERVRRRGRGRMGWRAPLASQSMKGVVSTPSPINRLRVWGRPMRTVMVRPMMAMLLS